MTSRSCAAILVLLTTGSPLAAQTPAPQPRGFVAVKVGTMHENAEDGLRQTSAALGFSAAVRLSPRWMVEGEVADNAIGSPEHRETLVSVSALRSFGRQGAHPYLTLGLTFGRNSETLTSCFAERVPFGGGAPVQAVVDCSEPDVEHRVTEEFSSNTSFLLAGGGVSIPLARRIHLAPEVLVHFAATAVILRPSLGLRVVF